MGVKLVYDDVPPGIKANVATVSATDVYSTLSNTTLSRAKQYNPDAFFKVATLEKDYWLLDGTFDISGATSNKPCIAWSNYIGNAVISGTQIKPTYTRTWNSLYTAPGITLVFGGDTYPTGVRVQWYNGTTELENQTYTPDSFTYFCEQAVTEFNKVVVTVESMPDYRFSKLVDIIDGRQVEFDRAKLSNIRLLEEISLTSENIPINQLNATVLQKTTDLNYTFQNTQNIDVYFDDVLYGRYFVTKNERAGEYKFSITAQDYKGVLDGSSFKGNYYSAQTFSTIIQDIIGSTVPYQIENNLSAETFTGAIPPGTKREALTAALLGACAVCDTSRRDYLYIYKPVINAVTVDVDDTFYGKGSYKTDNFVTSVVLTRHAYKLSDNLETVYDGAWIGEAGQWIQTVNFSNPIDTTTLVGTPASGNLLWIVKTPYYCAYRLTGTTFGTGVTMQAKQYIDTTNTVSKNNPHTVSGMQTNIKEVSSYTSMVTSANSTAVLNFLMNYYQYSNTLESKIHLQGEQVGDTMTINTDWQGTKTGVVEKLDYSLLGKTIGKATVHINA